MLLAEMLDQIVTVRFEAADLRWVVSTEEEDLRFQNLLSFAPFEAHLAYLLRHQAHHEDDDGGGEKQGAHVRKAT